MQHRPRIVQCRISLDEWARFSPLVREFHCDNFSELLRMALKRMAAEMEKKASDNAVIQTNGQTKTPASKPRAKKKPTRPAPSGRGKAAVKH